MNYEQLFFIRKYKLLQSLGLVKTEKDGLRVGFEKGCSPWLRGKRNRKKPSFGSYSSQPIFGFSKQGIYGCFGTAGGLFRCRFTAEDGGVTVFSVGRCCGRRTG
ncbi:hypothetical protein HanIR_Chr10g0480061 [Helianthus annuus]|nr:hypothetical protein HanIR_Chr10g0480061 [Helianthus annuus]